MLEMFVSCHMLSLVLRLSIIIITIVIPTSIQLSHSTSSSHKLMHCSFGFACCTVAQFLFELLTCQALGTTFFLTLYSCCSRAFLEVLLNLADKQQLVAALIWTREPEWGAMFEMVGSHFSVPSGSVTSWTLVWPTTTVFMKVVVKLTSLYLVSTLFTPHHSQGADLFMSDHLLLCQFGSTLIFTLIKRSMSYVGAFAEVTF